MSGGRQIDLFSLYDLYSHLTLRDATVGNSFFQMSSCTRAYSSYARANERLTYKKQKDNSHENITWSEMGKQNVPAKRSIGYFQVNKRSEGRGQCRISQHSSQRSL